MTEAPVVFDRRAVRRKRERAAMRVGSVAALLDDFAARLIERLDDTTRRFSRALDLGGRGVVAPLLRARGIAVVAGDLSPRMAALSGAPCLALDEEFLPFAPASFDLVIASLSLHEVNDLPGATISTSAPAAAVVAPLTPYCLGSGPRQITRAAPARA